ncbi:MAG: hypothetical protein M3N16_06135 [Actinomycetota bacterium]|nr:hypothetical protein [Actinomycetota bacterium]
MADAPDSPENQSSEGPEAGEEGTPVMHTYGVEEPAAEIDAGDLEGPALLALTSLCEAPDLTTAETMVTGPLSSHGVTTQQIATGLEELQSRGLAESRSGLWYLTDAGRERCAGE